MVEKNKKETNTVEEEKLPERKPEDRIKELEGAVIALTQRCKVLEKQNKKLAMAYDALLKVHLSVED